MLTLPFRIAFSIFVALFCASSLVRRAVAGIAVSAVIVAAQHGEAFSAFASDAGEAGGIATALHALAMLMGG